MATRRTSIGVIGGGILGGLSSFLPSVVEAAAGRPAKAVIPARLEPAHVSPKNRIVPINEGSAYPADYNYVDDEWFASGLDDFGQPYKTLVIVRRPRARSRFTGTVLVEPLHMAGVASVNMIAADYVLRSGHAWVCVVSQRNALETNLKQKHLAHYADLHIPGPRGTAAAPTERWQEIGWTNQASNAILAQVAAALRSGAGGLAELKPRNVLLIGHSQTGFVTTNFVREAHHHHRLPGGKPIFDGYFPAGFPAEPFGPCDVPLIQLISDGDTPVPGSTIFPNLPGRTYRRADGDDRTDKFRLYEIAGMPHSASRRPGMQSDPEVLNRRRPGLIVPGTKVSSFPHSEMMTMAIEHLVRWVDAEIAPPHADRLEVAQDGTYACDEHGNTRGGVRTVQMDVPHSTYLPNATGPDGAPVVGTFGLERSFSAERMKALYGTRDTYVRRFNQRVAQLIEQGWLLGADGAAMRDEALMQKF